WGVSDPPANDNLVTRCSGNSNASLALAPPSGQSARVIHLTYSSSVLRVQDIWTRCLDWKAHVMTTTERASRADLLLSKRSARIADELERSAADGWLIYDFRGSNPAFSRLLGRPGELKSTRRAFLYLPALGEPRMLIHHVDAGNLARLGLEVRPYGGREELVLELR